MTQDLENTPSAARLFAPGKKRILALDGGGVRGMITVAFLARIEATLREETGRPDYVLSDYFDLIGGTSVGSLLATMLSLGMEMREVEEKFRAWAPEIFKGRLSMLGIKRFDGRSLVQKIQMVTGEETLGSTRLHTGLAIVAKRVDTGSPWVMINNPRMKFFDDREGPEGWIGNRHYKLWSILRASTAAPFYFRPTRIAIHNDTERKDDNGVFVDGGVSPHNNPALQLFLMAGLPSYGLEWSRTPQDLSIISVGAGTHRTRVAGGGFSRSFLSEMTSVATGYLASDLPAAKFAAETLRTMVADGQTFGLKMLQAMSQPRFSWRINSEIGDLSGETFLPEPLQAGLLSFQRYDAPFELGLLPEAYDIAASKKERERMFAIDEPNNLKKLWDYGVEAAEKQVSREDFAGFL
ncbi:MAG: patatin-like phospholipase family protein [Pseudomonadota bacterium]